MNLLSSKCANSSNDFYANILLSQIESVEAVCHFEKKVFSNFHNFYYHREILVAIKSLFLCEYQFISHF